MRQFIWAMARQGHACTVISPVRWLDRRLGLFPPRIAPEDTGGGTAVTVCRPRHLTFSARDLGFTHTARWANATFYAAARRALASAGVQPDLVYGHFLYFGGHAAVRLARRLGVPAVVGVGEGEFWTIRPAGPARAAREMQGAAAFLAVSTCIAEELERTLGVPREKISVFPNGVDLAVFRPRNRAEMCRKLGIPESTFNVGFAGPFIAQKGYPELVAAVAGLAHVRLVLLGRGPHPPGDPQTAFCGAVAHADMPDYFGACDLYVLPTRIEGSCNSVIEAMACGLPVVTSNGRYMDDIVDDATALRVDPADVQALRAAIVALRDDPARRRRMSAAGLEKAKGLDINERARRVGAWMQNLAGNWRN